jgi:hypothetical protein
MTLNVADGLCSQKSHIAAVGQYQGIVGHAPRVPFAQGLEPGNPLGPQVQMPLFWGGRN